MIAVMFMELGKAYRLGEILKSSNRWQPTKGWDYFYEGRLPLETQCSDFNLETEGGLDWMKCLKNGAGKVFTFYAFIPALCPKVPLHSVCLNLNHEKIK